MSLLFHILTAYFSVGYHSADEQFQILEFLAYKLGKASVSDLAIEYSAQMRPWTQVGIYWVIVQIFKLFNQMSPFTWAFGIRLFTGLVGWFSGVTLGLCSMKWFTNASARRFVILSISLLWFLPALHVRPSSESLAGSTFLIGFCLVCLEVAKKDTSILKARTKISPLIFILSGLLFGISFECRFQVGLMISGFLAWLCLFKKPSAAVIGYLVFGLMISLGMGRLIDYWGYGVWTFTPWNYFRYNLLQGEVNRYGRAPWWDLFRMSFTESWPFLGLLVAISSIIAWIRYPKHPLTWSQVPFFIVHEWIPHKELRFFFPLVLSAPALLAMAFYSENRNQWVQPLVKFWRWIRWPWSFLVLNNHLALLALIFVPFSRTVQFYEGFYKQLSKNEPNVELYIKKNTRDPFEVLGSQIRFYRPSGLQVKSFQNFEDLMRIIKTTNNPVLVFHGGFEFSEKDSAQQKHCQLVFRTLPDFIKFFNYNDWLSRTNVWSLYRCDQL